MGMDRLNIETAKRSEQTPDKPLENNELACFGYILWPRVNYNDNDEILNNNTSLIQY